MKSFQTLLVLFLTFLTNCHSADYCLPLSGEVGVSYDYFRSFPEGDWEGNTGGYLSINVGQELPMLCDNEYGVQLGGSFGVYDWNGRLSAPSDLQSSTQNQAFLTIGFFKQVECESGINFGLVYDLMWSDHVGVFGIDASIHQLRFQSGYLLCNNEFGLWGTIDLGESHHTSQEILVDFRAISQINLFWRHYFCNCAETLLYAGLPYKKSLMFSDGIAGNFIIGGSVRAPLSSQLLLEGHASYMHPHSSNGLGQRNYAANISLELKWLFNGNSRAPYMSIGNNSNFIVDTNVNF